MKVHDNDLKFFVEGGDPGFSPARNKAVVERTIKKHEANIKRKNKAYEEQVRERASAVADYLKSQAANSGKMIDKYLSKEYMAHLRGQKRIEKIKTLLNGKQYIEFEEVN